MNRRIALSALSVLSTTALIGGGAFALFSDSAKSENNTFATGNADLQIAEDVEPGDPDVYGSSIAGVIFSDILPGFTTTKDFWLKNDSSGEFSMNVTAELDNVSSLDALSDALVVQFTCDTDNDGLGTGDSSTDAKPVSNWVDDGVATLGTVGPNEGSSNATTESDQDELLCRMTASLSSETGNEVADMDVSFDGLFVGTQVL